MIFSGLLISAEEGRLTLCRRFTYMAGAAGKKKRG